MKAYSFKHYLEIFVVATRLGLTSFGGPVAHLGFFQEEYVKRRKWLDDRTYADLIALCQFLPGPASSQVGISIGMVRGGLPGGILAWIGFTLPSVIALMLFAYFVLQADVGTSAWFQGLKLVAVAVVAHAILNMGKNLTPGPPADLPGYSIGDNHPVFPECVDPNRSDYTGRNSRIYVVQKDGAARRK